MNAIFSVITGMALFSCALLGFKWGLRLGMEAAKGITPDKIKNPVKAIHDLKTDIDQSKKAKEEAEDLEKMFAYNGDVKEGA